MSNTDPRTVLARGCEAQALLLQALPDAIGDAFDRMVAACERSLRAGGKIAFFGNGGSAADAQHLAAEFLIRFTVERPALAAIALTTDSSALTACGNDFGFERVFARQVEGLVVSTDTVIGISTSGTSPNVVEGLRAAKARGATAVGLTGASGGALTDICDCTLMVPSTVTARIQECHILIGHALCTALEARLGYA